MKKKTISLYTDFNEWRFLSRKLPYKGILEDSGKPEREITQEKHTSKRKGKTGKARIKKDCNNSRKTTNRMWENLLEESRVNFNMQFTRKPENLELNKITQFTDRKQKENCAI